jgi:F-type H+-transporting ATPase subunit delta
MNISEINLYANEFVSYLENKKTNLAQFCHEIKSFLNQIENNSEAEDIKKFLLASPVTIDEKISLLKIFTQNEDLLKFCEILAKKSKLADFFSILRKMIAINNDKNNVKDVKVFSVVNLTEEQLKKINLLIKKYFSCDGNIENIIDKSIIGGFVVEIDTYSLDLSIRNQLNSIERKVFA